MNRGSTKTN